MNVGVGLGVGIGVGEGVGVGVGAGVGLGVGDCACADEAATASRRTKPRAMARTRLRAAPVFLAREGPDEQRMNANPKKAPNPQNCKIPVAGGDLPPVLPRGQSVLVPARMRMAAVA